MPDRHDAALRAALEDHCEGIAGGILAALEAHGYVLAAADAHDAASEEIRP